MSDSPASGITTKARLNLKIDEDLKEWAKEYARRNGTDITKLITRYFLQLREEERRYIRGVDCVEQI